MSIVHTGPAVYVNADKSAVVDESSPDAAFLMVGPNGVVDKEFIALYRAHFGGDDVPAETDEPRTVVFGEPDPPPDPEPDGAAPDDTNTEAPAATAKPRKRAAKSTT